MSTTIDEKVVEMRFDNRDFEKNVKTSMNTLDNLKKSLKFDDAAQSFTNLEKASKGVKFDGISNAIETVKVKFSGMQIAIARILSNIVDDAYYYGKRLVKSLSVDQITAGWDKYAQKTSSVQTIMAATAKDFEDTGEQMEFVNGQLEKLNWFTDETSYNFLDMVNNIGKFTSNNVKLEDAVTAMQGISNWAAISGGTVNEASRAMYNLSQALAMGEVKLMDWRSIQNANMATYEFKEQVLETAIALKTVTKVGEDAYKVGSKTYTLLGLFDDGLSQGWFTSDVLLQTLNRYGEFTNKLYEASEDLDMTATDMLQAIDKYKDGTEGIDEIAAEAGVSVSDLSKYLKILSDDEYELGRRAFKAAQEAKTFQEAIDSVKDAVSTGWMNTFEYIFGDYQTAKKIWTTLANELYDVFAEAGNERNEILRLWSLMGGRDTLFQGIANVWNNLKNIFSSIKDGFREIFPKSTVATLINITTAFRDFTERIMMSEENLDRLKRTFKGFAAVLDIGRQLISAFWGGFKQFLSLIKPLGGSLLETTANIGDFLVKLRDWIKENEIFVRVVNRIIEAIKFLASGIDNLLRKMTGYGVVELIKKLGDNLSYAYQKISLIFKLLFGHNTPKQITELVDRFKELTGMSFKDSKLFQFFARTKQIFTGFKTLVSDLVHGVGFGDAISKFFGSTFGFDPGKMTGIFIKIGEGFKTAWSKVSETFQSFKAGFGDFADIIKKRWDGIKEAFSGAKDVIVEAWEKIKEVISEVTGTDLNGMSKFGKVISVLLYPIQLFFTALKYIFQGLGMIIEDFGPTILGFLKKVGSGFISFAKQIGGALKNADFSKVIDLITSGSLAIILGKLAKSLLGFSKVSKNLGSMGKGADGQFSILVFLKNLVTSGKQVIGTISETFVNLLDSIRGVFVAWQRDLQANVLFKIGAAILMLSAALVMLSGIDKESLTTAVGAITLLFTELVSAFKLITSSMNVETALKGAGGIKDLLTSYMQMSSFVISLAAALLIMSVALKNIASLDQDQLKRSILGITVIFAELTVFLTYISKHVKTSEIAIKGLVKLALALYVMAMAVKKLAKLDTKAMLQGVAGLGLILIELVAFIRLLGTNLKSAKMTEGNMQFQSLTQMASGILILAVALKMLVSSVKKMGKMDPKALEQGLLGLAGILAIIDGFVYLFKSPGKDEAGIMRIASMMMVMSLALVIISSALKIVGTMDFEQVSNALIGFAGVMGILVLMFENVAGNKNTVGAAGAMLMIANSMVLIAAAMRIMGTMDFEHVSSALIGFAGAVAIIVIALDSLKGEALEILKLAGALLVFSVAFTVLATAMKIMSTINVEDMLKTFVAVAGIFGVMSLFSAFTEGFNAIKAAASILVIANALLVLAPALMMFKVIDLGNVFTMLAALAGIVTILGVAATTLSSAMLPLLAVSGAITLFGLGIMAMGAGFVMLAAGLTALGASLPVLVEFLAILSASLLSFIPKVIITFFKTVLEAIINFGKDILLAIIATANAILPPLIELIFNFVDSLLESLKNHLPNIVQNLIDLILDLLDVLGQNSYKIVDRLMNLVFDIIEGFGEAFKKNIRRAVEVITDLLFNIFAGAFDAVFGWIGDLIFGKTEEVVKDVEELLTDEQRKVVNHVREMSKSYEELDKSRDINLTGIQNEYKYIEDLGKEYNSLVGENGKIKAGYEDRAEVILTTMANAMGIERDEIDKLIDKNGLLSDSYNDVIAVMKAKAYMEANEEAYKEALKNQTDANNNYIKSTNEFTKSTKRRKEVIEELAEVSAEYYDKVDRGEGWDHDLFDRMSALEEEKKKLDLTLGTLHANMDEASRLNSQYSTEIYNYEGMLVAYQKGNVSAMEEFMDYYNTGLVTAANGNKKILEQQVSDAKTKLEELKYALNEDIAGVTEEDVGKAQKFYTQSLHELAMYEAGFTDKAYNFGNNWVDETAKGITDNKGTLASASMQSVDALEEPYKDLKMSDMLDEETKEMYEKYGLNVDEMVQKSGEGAEDSVDAMINSFEDGQTDAKSAGTKLAISFLDPIENRSKYMAGIATDYVDGFVNQAVSRGSMTKVEEAAVSLAAHFMSIYAKTGDAHSPSRKMAEIGTWFVQGFVNGVNSLKDLVGLSAEDLAQTSIDTMADTLSSVSDIFGSDLDVDPTIRPLIDLSNIEDGVDTINGMFGSNRELELAGSINRDSKAILNARLQNGLDVNNRDVVGAIGKLRSDVNVLNQNMSRLQVVMDTGALVGQISSPIDMSLGRQTIYKQRGV